MHDLKIMIGKMIKQGFTDVESVTIDELRDSLVHQARFALQRELLIHQEYGHLINGIINVIATIRLEHGHLEPITYDVLEDNSVTMEFMTSSMANTSYTVSVVINEPDTENCITSFTMEDKRMLYFSSEDQRDRAAYRVVPNDDIALLHRSIFTQMERSVKHHLMDFAIEGSIHRQFCHALSKMADEMNFWTHRSEEDRLIIQRFHSAIARQAQFVDDYILKGKSDPELADIRIAPDTMTLNAQLDCKGETITVFMKVTHANSSVKLQWFEAGVMNEEYLPVY